MSKDFNGLPDRTATTTRAGDEREATTSIALPLALVERLTKWRLCMSYNDSYFGEPAGELKRIALEMEKSIPVSAHGLTNEQIVEMARDHSHLFDDGASIWTRDSLVEFARALLRTSSASAQEAEDEPLTCDFCGAQTEDPWHTSDATRKHLHQCDACHADSGQKLTDEQIDELGLSVGLLVRIGITGRIFANDSLNLHGMRTAIRDILRASIRKYDSAAQPGSPEFDGAEAYQAHLENIEADAGYRNEMNEADPQFLTVSQAPSNQYAQGWNDCLAELSNSAAEPAAWQSTHDLRFVTTDPDQVRQWRQSGYGIRPLYV